MDKFIIVIGTIFLAIAAIFGFIILSTFLGALAGWCVGLVFGDVILGQLAQLGLHTTMWQFGALMGFVGGFMKTTTTVKQEK